MVAPSIIRASRNATSAFALPLFDLVKLLGPTVNVSPSAGAPLVDSSQLVVPGTAW